MMLTAMQLAFRAAADGLVVATEGADYVGCQFAWVTAGAQTIWPLDENTSSGQPVQQQILAIAGVHWPYPAAAPVAARGSDGVPCARA